MKRDYSQLAMPSTPAGDRTGAMQAFVDTVWDAFEGADVSWVGFYLLDPTNDQQLVLGPLRNKPACSPIGMHGACGQCFQAAQPLVVPDVAALGEGYIACDPRDVAEVVVPCFDADGVWGVLDLDSFSRGAFEIEDALALNQLLQDCGLTNRAFTPEDVQVVVPAP